MSTISGARLGAAALLLPLSLIATACSSSDSTSAGSPGGASLEVDASAAPAFLKFGTVVAETATVATPATSTAWDAQFFATEVTLNGGAAGPGGVSGYCICQNAAATDGAVQAMTPANELADFTAVTTGQIPADSLFVSDKLDPVVKGWFTGTPGSAIAPDTTMAWVVRRGGATTIYGKFRVTLISSSTATSAGMVTIQYAIQPSAGAAFGALAAVALDGRAGPVYLNLATGATASTPPATWDLELDGYNIRVNGGVSGSGGVGAVLGTPPGWLAIDATLAASIPAQVFKGDGFGGVFATKKWYRYNITGTDNQIWPTFNVYLIKRGTSVWKVQLTGYYSATAAPRHITVRYAKLKG
jgi:hypothetical protein